MTPLIPKQGRSPLVELTCPFECLADPADPCFLEWPSGKRDADRQPTAIEAAVQGQGWLSGQIEDRAEARVPERNRFA